MQQPSNQFVRESGRNRSCVRVRFETGSQPSPRSIVKRQPPLTGSDETSRWPYSWQKCGMSMTARRVRGLKVRSLARLHFCKALTGFQNGHGTAQAAQVVNVTGQSATSASFSASRRTQGADGGRIGGGDWHAGGDRGFNCGRGGIRQIQGGCGGGGLRSVAAVSASVLSGALDIIGAETRGAAAAKAMVEGMETGAGFHFLSSARDLPPVTTGTGRASYFSARKRERGFVFQPDRRRWRWRGWQAALTAGRRRWR